MLIHFIRDGQRHGPYPLAEIRRQLQLGDLSPEALAWREGLDAWVSLGTIPGVVLSVPSSAAPPPIPTSDAPPSVAVAESVVNIRIPKLAPPEAPPASPLARIALPSTPSGFAPAPVSAESGTGLKMDNDVTPDEQSLRFLKAPPIQTGRLDPQPRISAAELFQGDDQTRRPRNERRWPMMINLALLGAIAGWLVGRQAPPLPGPALSRVPAATAPSNGVGAASAASGLGGGDLSAAAVPVEARFNEALAEARMMMKETNWVVSVRRKLSEAQAIKPGNPAVVDTAFALEARVLETFSKSSQAAKAK